MEKKYKAQVSVEMLAILGVIILGSLVFATYYLSSVNKNIDKATDLDVDLSTTVPSTTVGSTPPIGPGGTDPLSICDNPALKQCEPGDTQLCPDGINDITCNPNCTWNYSNCTDPYICGDNSINQAWEVCDGTDLAGRNCTHFIDPLTGDYFDGGVLTCNAGCLSVNTSACFSSGGGGGIPTPICGDDLINQPSEVCDGIDLDGMSCADFGFALGSLSCVSDCSAFNTSNCHNLGMTCGNNILEPYPSEHCDTVNGTLEYNHLNCEDYYLAEFGESGWSGDLGCSACAYDLSGCEYNSGTPQQFVLEVNPSSNVVEINSPSSTTADITFNDASSVVLSVTAGKLSGPDYLPTAACFYAGNNIPATGAGYTIGTYFNTTGSETIINNISCNESGDFRFIFKGVDNEGLFNDRFISLEVTNTTPPPVYNLLISHQKNNSRLKNILSNVTNPSSGSFNYVEGTNVNLSLNSLPVGIAFRDWVINGTTYTTPNQTVLMNDNKNATATFKCSSNEGCIFPHTCNVSTGLCGCPSGYICIYDWHDLHNIRNNLTANYMLMNHLTTTTNGYNTYNSGQGWSPIGPSSSFTGIFEGNNFVINGLNINRSSHFQALFTEIGTTGQIKNLRIYNANISGTYHVAILAATNRGLIDNVRVSGNLTATGAGTVGTVGGLVTANLDATINNSVANVNITSSHMGVGGLVSYITNSSIISNSSSTGSIQANLSDDVGGLIGIVQPGNETTQISNSFSKVNVYGNDNVGGFIGSTFYSINNNGKVIIQDSYATGTVDGADYLGGFIGEFKSNNQHNISSISNSYSTGNIGNDSAGNYVGGFVGKLSMANISGSYSTGDILRGNSHLGGFVGSFSYGNSEELTYIQDCYSTGDLISEFPGNNRGGFIGSDSQYSFIQRSYRTGNIFLTQNTTYHPFFGESGPQSIDCDDGYLYECQNYYSTDSITLPSGTTLNTNTGNARTTAQMTYVPSSDTYQGWGFPVTWKISSTNNNGYPYLAWQAGGAVID